VLAVGGRLQICVALVSLLAVACEGDASTADTAPTSERDTPATVGATTTGAKAKATTGAETETDARTETDAGTETETETRCTPALKTSLARRSSWGPSAHVDVVDPDHNLDRFFAAWIDVVNGKRRKLRIAVFGDSNTQGDWAAAFLRKRLGAELGLGGHGIVGPGKPNPWYEHRAIRTRQGDGWTTYSVSPHSSRTRQPRGVAGMVGVGAVAGAWLEWRPARGIESPLPANERFSRAHIHYICAPGGGRFDVRVDRKRVRTIDTDCPEAAYRVADLRVPLARHRVRIFTTKPRVVVFGASFENDDPGVVIDGIGINSANYKWLLRADEHTFHAGLAARKYDLVILATGISMWAELDHYGLAAAFIGRFRHALGDDVSILVMPPGVWGNRKGERVWLRSHILRVVKEKREVAARNHTGFWNYFAAMGGKRALRRLMARKQIYRDLLHFPPITHAHMMHRLAAALDDAFAAYLDRNHIDCASADATAATANAEHGHHKQ